MLAVGPGELEDLVELLREPPVDVVADVPRSKPSVVIATFQPLLTPPTTFSAGQRTSVKKTSLNSAEPSGCTIGRTSTPGLLHRHEEVADALVLRRVGVGAGEQEDVVGVLGLRGPHLLPVDDPLVAVEHGGGLEAGEVGSGVRARRTPGTS